MQITFLGATGTVTGSKHLTVLIDDIISTAHTLIAAVKILLAAKMLAPICIGVHAIFVGTCAP